MMCKSSRPCPTKLSAFGWIVVFLLAVSVATGGARAQQQPTLSKEPKSYIRFWNMLPVVPTNNLLVLSGDKSMFGVSPGDVYKDYFASPVGSCTLVLKRVGEKQDPVANVPVALLSGTYLTLLATDKGGGQINVQVINDTPDPKVTELTAQLVVRSFFTGGNVTVGLTGGQPPQPVPGGGTVTLDNLPMTAALNVALQVTMPTTPPRSKKWDLPADFSVIHHATLLLMTDQSGRLKPQLVYNGHLANPEGSQDRDRVDKR